MSYQEIVVRNAQDVATQSLLNAAKMTNQSLGSFSSWLIAGVGTAFSLLFANLDKVNRFVDFSYVRTALLLLVLSLIFSVLTRLISTIVSSALGAHEASAAFMSQFLASGKKLDLDVFIIEFQRGLFPYQRWIARRSMKKARDGDQVAGARLIAKLSQVQALLMLIEVSLSVAAATALVVGLKI
jgi:uncharacterized membrane protein